MSEDQPLDIVSVLTYYGFDIPSPEGGWRTVKCQFHEDSSASGRYSPDAGAYGCQACPAKGNAITLIMWKEGVTYGEANDKYCAITGGKVSFRQQEVAVTRAKPFERGAGIVKRNSRRRPFGDR